MAMLNKTQFLFIFLSFVLCSAGRYQLNFNPEIAEPEDLPCDPEGTSQNSDFFASSQARNCDCNELFYGDRCHKIRRCRSGVVANVSCTTEARVGGRLGVQSKHRCFPGQHLLEVCVCWPGYTGVLCDKQETTRIRPVVNPDLRQASSSAEVQRGEEMDYLQILEKLEETKQKKAQELDPVSTWKAILFNVMLVLSLVCIVRYACMRERKRILFSVVEREHATRRRSERQREENMLIQGGHLFENPRAAECRPPSYSEVMASKTEAETAEVLDDTPHATESAAPQQDAAANQTEENNIENAPEAVIILHV